MATAPPRELTDLLAATDPTSEEQAWETFVERYSRSILNAARRFSADYDDSMDRYGFILEELRKDDCKRLRGYAVDARSRFSTWLMVVARRLCLDYHRKLYGRDRPSSEATRESRVVRRRLVDLVAEELDPEGVGDLSRDNPERALRRTELSGALESVLTGLVPEERLLLKLRFEDDLPVTAVARAMRYPTVFHVYRRLNPLLARLRKDLEERGIGAPDP
jgi:RNA polymerase sigma factor (sigma-70 family)